jgi:hypothetical protein
MIVDKITGYITIDLTKPYRRDIIHEALLTDFVSRGEDSQMSEMPAQPTLWRILGKDDRDQISQEWLEHVTCMGELCQQMGELALTNHDTFEWRYGHKDLIEAIEKARAEIREYVGEAPVELFGLMGEFITEADAMMSEYGTTDKADRDHEQEDIEPDPAFFHLAGVEIVAAIYRTLESHLLGLDLDNGIESDLGIPDEKLNAAMFDALGGRFVLYARVVRALAEKRYPTDLQAFVLLEELVADVDTDVDRSMDGQERMLCESRREWVKLARDNIGDRSRRGKGGS